MEQDVAAQHEPFNPHSPADSRGIDALLAAAAATVHRARNLTSPAGATAGSMVGRHALAPFESRSAVPVAAAPRASSSVPPASPSFPRGDTPEDVLQHREQQTEKAARLRGELSDGARYWLTQTISVQTGYGRNSVLETVFRGMDRIGMADVEALLTEYQRREDERAQRGE